MKIKSFAALIAASLCVIVISCNWLGSSDEPKVANPLIGKWHLDSVQSGKDTSLAHLLLFMSMNDSAGIDLEFKPDTILTYSNKDIDTTSYSFDEAKSQLITKDSLNNVYNVLKINDSAIHLKGNDSSVLFLRKK